jgi:YesN/AraC family two-component response regulator
MRREILIVDDDLAVREVVAVALQDAYDVTPATTGAQALDIIRHDRVALVVLDYRLPDCTGLQLLGEIKGARPDLPVVMLTGYGSEAICASALKLGIRDYFYKPFSVFELRRSVRKILSTDGNGGEEASANGDGEVCGATLPVPVCAEMAIQRVAVLIQQRYWDHLTLAGLAREGGVSKYQLSRRFHEVMGVTLRGYLLRARLGKAKELLAITRAQVTEVALAVGFGDLPRFDKVFKRYTGLTPSSYRSSDQRHQFR